MKTRSYSKYAIEAARFLGKEIKAERKQRGWSEEQLAERADISRLTLRKIEAGDMSCSIGLVFEVASIVNIPLFEDDLSSLRALVKNTQDKLTLLPKRSGTKKKVVDDDF